VSDGTGSGSANDICGYGDVHWGDYGRSVCGGFGYGDGAGYGTGQGNGWGNLDGHGWAEGFDWRIGIVDGDCVDIPAEED
jgi:hypothetical protein